MSDESVAPSPRSTDALLQWRQVFEHLDQVRRGVAMDSAFCAMARSQKDLLGALPVRYATVLSDLLDRLESSALFTEESCSFSRKDLLESLQMWLDKARQRLPG